MRSLILVVVTAFALSMGALVYFWVQPTHTRNKRASEAALAKPVVPRNTRNDFHVSDGDHAAVKKYDQATGELSSEFLAEEYHPQRGGLIDVKNATARFYMTNGQIVEIHGVTGQFRTDTPQQGKNKPTAETRAGAPTSGKLKDVTVTIIEPARTATGELIRDAKGAPTTRPSLTIAMDNAAFDGENATIRTEGYKDPKTGEFVAEDQVPVTIRSPETNPNGYDFDGRGMKLSWNERDHRLSSLDIAHGERLVIKNPKAVTQSKQQGGPTAPATQPARTAMSFSGPRPLSAALASAADGHVYLALGADGAGDEPAQPDAKATTRPAGRARRGTGRARPAPTPAPTPTPDAGNGQQMAPPAPRTGTGRRPRPYAPPPPATMKFVPNLEPPIYRAEFHKDVRIVQDGQPLATSDHMFVDFWLQSGDDSSSGATGSGGGSMSQRHGKSHGASTTQATTTAAASRPATAAPATEPGDAVAAVNTPAATAPATRPAIAATTSRPTTRSTDEAPIYIYWTGPLHVAPHSDVSLPQHESIVTLEGAPVVARQQNSEICASKLVYRSEDGSLRGAALPGAEIVMTSTDSRGTSVIHTTGLEYLAHATPPTAVLSGRSTAELPATADGAKMNASWNDRCTLHFENLPDGRSAIKEAELTGGVHIDHPQLHQDSGRLELAFAPPPPKSGSAAVAAPATEPTSQPSVQMNLRQMVASDNVHCVLIDNEKSQTIDTDRLTLLTDSTPDGKMMPRTVNADGRVHAVDAEQDLHAGHLAVTLAPTTKPASTRLTPQVAAAPMPTPGAATKPSTRRSGDDNLAGAVDLQSAIAHESVHVVNRKDGTEAFADTMLVDKKDGKTAVKLVGQPTAKVIDKTNVITGPVIDLYPDDQQMSIDGGGHMIGSQQEHPGEAAKPMDVTWTRSLRVDGKTNVVDALGDVVAKTKDADGTVNTARGDRARLFLADVATTQPTTRPSAATKPVTVAAATTEPSTKPSSHEAMGHKTVRQAVFEQNAQVSSTLQDNEGLPLRRMNLFAAVVQYDVLPPTTAPATTAPVTGGPAEQGQKRVTVPVPGKMLVEDYRPPTTQTAAASSADPTGGAGARGATAFQWGKSLVYDDAIHRVVMDGGVVIDHRDDIQSSESMHLTGDTVTADLEPLPAASKPATAPSAATQQAATKPAGAEAPRYQVRKVVAKGHLLVTMRGGELVADSIDYDPVTKILIAHGSDKGDAIFTRSQPTPGGTQPIRAQEMQWDAGNDLPKITKAAASLRR